jgi:hypothetical protein
VWFDELREIKTVSDRGAAICVSVMLLVARRRLAISPGKSRTIMVELTGRDRISVNPIASYLEGFNCWICPGQRSYRPIDTSMNLHSVKRPMRLIDIVIRKTLQ